APAAPSRKSAGRSRGESRTKNRETIACRIRAARIAPPIHHKRRIADPRSVGFWDSRRNYPQPGSTAMVNLHRKLTGRPDLTFFLR
ncbi:MAG: hypothetical protein LC634_08990, partial [Sphingomonadales bacterium]|nr:hypothetical protein [Sphingomonadales bacterium]